MLKSTSCHLTWVNFNHDEAFVHVNGDFCLFFKFRIKLLMLDSGLFKISHLEFVGDSAC